MTQEEKELLLKDLSARVPYHPKGHVVNACNGAEIVQSNPLDAAFEMICWLKENNKI